MFLIKRASRRYHFIHNCCKLLQRNRNNYPLKSFNSFHNASSSLLEQKKSVTNCHETTTTTTEATATAAVHHSTGSNANNSPIYIKNFFTRHCSDLFFLSQKSPVNLLIYSFYNQFLSTCVRLGMNDQKEDINSTRWISDYKYVSQYSWSRTKSAIKDMIAQELGQQCSSALVNKRMDMLHKKIVECFHIILQRFQSYTGDGILVQFCRIMFNVMMLGEQLRHVASSCEQLIQSISFKRQYASNSPNTTAETAQEIGSDYDLILKICDIFMFGNRVNKVLNQYKELMTAQTTIAMKNILQELNERINKEPLLEDYYLLRISVNLELRNYIGVIQDCDIVVEKGFSSPNSFSYLLYRGLAYKGIAAQNKKMQNNTLKEVHLEQALSTMDRCIEMKPDEVILYLHAASLHFVSNDYIGAINYVKEAVNLIKDNKFDTTAVDHMFNSVVFNYCQTMLPANQAQLINYLVEAVRAGRSRLADKMFSEAFSMTRKDQLYLVYYLRGAHFLENSKLTNAIKDLQKSTSLNPYFPVAFFDLGVCYQKLAMEEDSIERIKLLNLSKKMLEHSLTIRTHPKCITEGFDPAKAVMTLAAIAYYQKDYKLAENYLLKLMDESELSPLPTSDWKQSIIDNLALVREKLGSTQPRSTTETTE
jgi:tetratricopeptide (TPR) repeat protein